MLYITMVIKSECKATDSYIMTVTVVIIPEGMGCNTIILSNQTTINIVYKTNIQVALLVTMQEPKYLYHYM